METDKLIEEEMHTGKPLIIIVIVGGIVCFFSVIYFIVALVTAIFNLIKSII
jgi:hypothetical protein